jgi:hypothetical protein
MPSGAYRIKGIARLLRSINNRSAAVSEVERGVHQNEQQRSGGRRHCTDTTVRYQAARYQLMNLEHEAL